MHQLWLKVGRTVVYERGYGLTHVPGNVSDYLSAPEGSTFAIDPLTGYACAEPEWSLDDAFEWEHEDPSAIVDGSVDCVIWPVHSTDDQFVAGSTADVAAGAGFNFVFLVYEGAGAMYLDFGGEGPRFSLRLEAGVAELLDDQGATLGFAALWPLESFYGEPHKLFVYCAGRTLCVRRPGDVAMRGIKHTVATGWPTASAPLVVRGTGRMAWQAAPERHAEGLAFQHERIALPEPCTLEPEASVSLVGPGSEDPELPGPDVVATMVVTRFDADGAEIVPPEPPAEGEEPEPEPKCYAFDYKVTVELPGTGPNVHISRVRVTFPQRVGPDGLLGTDLLAVPGVALRGVTETLTQDGGGAKLSFELVANRGQFSPYVQPNMTLQWWPFGIQRFTGLTSKPDLQVVDGGQFEQIAFECEDRGKLLRESFWTGDGSYGGKLLGDAYRDVVRKAGLQDDEIVIMAGGYKLPEEKDDGPALFDFRPDQRVDDVLRYLHESFGAEHVLRFAPDGLFHAEEAKSVGQHSGVTFGVATSSADLAAIASGASGSPRVLRGSWHEELVEDGFANVVAVVGADEGGRPLLAMMTDWSSINDPTASNYWGSFRPMIVVDGGLTSQELVNWVCAQVYYRVRQLRVRASWRAMYLPALTVGDWVDVVGQGSWQLTGMSTVWERDQPQGLTSYSAVRGG